MSAHMTDANTEFLFQLQDVRKTYGAVNALNGLTLTVPHGAIGLLGPNGAGKTTMIRTLLGLIRIDSGTGTVLGHDIRSERMWVRQNVGFVPEDECLFPGLEGVEFVAFAGELCGMPIKESMQRAHEVLDYCGLGEARYRRVESYSTGMKQRIKLAAAIVHDPKLLILDEPTNGLDPKGREDMLELAYDLAHNKGMSLIFSSHLLPDVEHVCDYVLVMAQGRLLTQGRISDLKRGHEKMYEVRLKSDHDLFTENLKACGVGVTTFEENLIVQLPADRDASFIWQIAEFSGLQVRHFRPRRSSLEEVFFQTLGENA